MAENVRKQMDLKRLVETLTMQGRMTRWIVSALPIGIVLVLSVEKPHYLSRSGRVDRGEHRARARGAWAVAGSFMIKRIVEIEV